MTMPQAAPHNYIPVNKKVDYQEYDLIGNILESKRWIFAKTMPHMPHWYTLRKEWGDDQLFDQVVTYIRKFGYTELYNGKEFTAFNLNGMKYWTMGSPLPQTILINRKPHEIPAQYDKIADVYDELHSDKQSEQENWAIIDMIQPVNGSVIDIGCGSGLFLDYQTIEPANYMGVDPSYKIINRLIEKHPKFKERVIVSRFEEYVGRKVDLIVSLFGAANYIELDALKRIPSMIMPGGRYFIMLYKQGYSPITYQRAGVIFNHFNYNTDILPGHVFEFGNFNIIKSW